jgi:hypothetical protein
MRYGKHRIWTYPGSEGRPYRKTGKPEKPGFISATDAVFQYRYKILHNLPSS